MSGQQKQPRLAIRRYTLLFLFMLAAAVLVWRAIDQQILEKDFLQSEGAERYLAKVAMEAHRGLITDRRGDVLALSAPMDSIAVNPRLLPTDPQSLVVLAKALQMPVGRLRDKLLRYQKRHYVYLKRRIPPGQAAYVMQVAKSHQLQGVYVERESKRFYPAIEAFAHVLGFTNHEDIGQEGLELAYDQALRGLPGEKRVLRDGRRQVVDDVENILSPQDGQNLALSIDARLQYIAYRELKAAVKKHRAVGGSAVLLDTRTGEVLAMVNQPGFNPNDDRSSAGGRLRNRAVTDVFEPGSTVKPFVVAAALQAGAVKVDTQIDTAPGFMQVGSSKIKDHHNLGKIDIATLLRRSSNVGAAKLALALPKEALWLAFDALGFGHAARTGFPAEASGLLTEHEDWTQLDQAILSFGYGLSVSTLQLARAYAVLANDGLLVPATLLKQTRAAQGKRVMQASVAKHVRQLLEAVTSTEGTAPQAAINAYRVAGKTGTVKKLGPEGYSEDRYQAIFAGMAPASHPRLVMVVMVDEPKSQQYYGGQVAGPVFSKVMGEALRLLNIRPDALNQQALRLAQLTARSEP
jgi:cell division protein FtsI (penicillin-binding protein 3)